MEHETEFNADLLVFYQWFNVRMISDQFQKELSSEIEAPPQHMEETVHKTIPHAVILLNEGEEGLGSDSQHLTRFPTHRIQGKLLISKH